MYVICYCAKKDPFYVFLIQCCLQNFQQWFNLTAVGPLIKTLVFKLFIKLKLLFKICIK